MKRLMLLLALGPIAAPCATIDGGSVVHTRPFTSSLGSSVLFSLSSADGGFHLQPESPWGLLGGGNMDCILSGGFCAFGQYSITGYFPVLDNPAWARLDVNGVSYANAIIGCNGLSCPQTILWLAADKVQISAPGDYVVPFRAWGQLQAAADYGTGFLIDLPLAGQGDLIFRAAAAGSGFTIVAVPAPWISELHPLELAWLFRPVPEPSAAVPTILVVALLLVKRWSPAS